jgi:hypothetical protein
MEKHVSLVVAQIVDGVVSIIWVRKCANFKRWEPIQVEDLFEITNTVSGKVQVFQVCAHIETSTDVLYMVPS